MRKIINQVRDIEVIEKELNSNMVGILALSMGEDKMAQVATPYLYLDKNIYIFFSEEDELFEHIKFQTEVSFTILKNKRAKKLPKTGLTSMYHIFSITISGFIRKADDQKTVDELKKNYLKKYSGKEEESEGTLSKLNKIVLIDSREIQAIEEIGG